MRHADPSRISFGAEGEEETSPIYWGSASGPDPERRQELPTVAAAGVVIVGAP